MDNITDYIISLSYFISAVLIPFLFALALLFFLFNAFKYFIATSDDSDGREKAKSLALYGIAAFVFLVIFWGLVNLLIRGLALNDDQYVVPDYVEMNSNSGGGYYYYSPGIGGSGSQGTNTTGNGVGSGVGNAGAGANTGANGSLFNTTGAP